VEEGQNGHQAEGELKAEPDVDDHQDEGDHHCQGSLVTQFASHLGPHQVDLFDHFAGEVSAFHVFRQVGLNDLDNAVFGLAFHRIGVFLALNLDQEGRIGRFSDILDLGFREAVLLQDGAQLGDLQVWHLGIGRFQIDFGGNAAGEVNAPIQAICEDRDQAHDQ